MPENTSDSDPTADSTSNGDEDGPLQPIEVDFRATLSYSADQVAEYGITPPIARENLKENIRGQPLEFGRITTRRSLRRNDNHVHIVKDDTGRVWFVSADSADDAENRVRNEIQGPDEDIKVFYEGTSADNDPRDDPDRISLIR